MHALLFFFAVLMQRRWQAAAVRRAALSKGGCAQRTHAGGRCEPTTPHQALPLCRLTHKGLR